MFEICGIFVKFFLNWYPEIKLHSHSVESAFHTLHETLSILEAELEGDRNNIELKMTR